jgi:hypothetical protein
MVNLSKLFATGGHAPSLEDEALHEIVAREMVANIVKPGLWTKALADTQWDESKAKALYVRMRVDQLKAGSVIPDRLAAANEAREYGLSDDEIELLTTPIMAIRYLKKYRVSQAFVERAIASGKIRAVLCRDVLWLEDRRV